MADWGGGRGIGGVGFGYGERERERERGLEPVVSGGGEKVGTYSVDFRHGEREREKERERGGWKRRRDWERKGAEDDEFNGVKVNFFC